LVFYGSDQFSAKYRNGAFVSQQESWNQAQLAGYKVAFIPFVNGKPQQPVDFLTGFVAEGDGSKVYGRPVCTAVAPNGCLLVNDDDSEIIWMVSAEGE